MIAIGTAQQATIAAPSIQNDGSPRLGDCSPLPGGWHSSMWRGYSPVSLRALVLAAIDGRLLADPGCRRVIRCHGDLLNVGGVSAAVTALLGGEADLTLQLLH